MLVNTSEHVLVSGVGDPFLGQSVRYHSRFYDAAATAADIFCSRISLHDGNETTTILSISVNLARSRENLKRLSEFSDRKDNYIRTGFIRTSIIFMSLLIYFK